MNKQIYCEQGVDESSTELKFIVLLVNYNFLIMLDLQWDIYIQEECYFANYATGL